MTHQIGRQPRSHHMTYIRAFLTLAALYLTAAVPSIAATLLPNGKQTFVSSNGTPLAAGTVDFYIPGTTTRKNTYQDSTNSVLNANPVVLDSAGRAVIYGTGCYRQVVKTSAGVTQWDQTTCDTSSTEASWGGTASGTPNAIVVTAANFTGADGQVIRFIAAANNTGPTTVNPSGFGAVAVMVDGGSGPVACSGGEIIQNNVVTLIYDANSGVFHLSTLTTITAGAGLSASGVGSSGGTLAVSGTLTSVQPVNSQTGTSYTVLTTDNAKLLTLSNTAAVAVTLPAATGSFGAGFWFDATNLNSGAVTITPASGTINGASSLILATNNHGRFVSNGTNWFFAGNGGASAVSGATTGYRSLLIVNNTGSENTQVAVTADYLSLVDTNGISFAVRSVSVTCNYAVNGANGLDTGTFALSSWYYHWVISNGSTTACLGSLSATAPTMPSGYTFKMRVGANRTNGSTQFNRVIQRNNIANYQIVAGSPTAVGPVMGNANTGTVTDPPTWTAVATTNYVPTTASNILGNISCYVSSGGVSWAAVIVAPSNAYGGISSTTNPPPVAIGPSQSTPAAGAATTEFDFVLLSTNIYWANSCGSVGILRAKGWIDNI